MNQLIIYFLEACGIVAIVSFLVGWGWMMYDWLWEIWEDFK